MVGLTCAWICTVCAVLVKLVNVMYSHDGQGSHDALTLFLFHPELIYPATGWPLRYPVAVGLENLDLFPPLLPSQFIESVRTFLASTWLFIAPK